MLKFNPFNRRKEDVSEMVDNADLQKKEVVEVGMEEKQETGEAEEDVNFIQIHKNVRDSKEMMNLILAVEQVASQYQLSAHKQAEFENRLQHQSEQIYEQQKENNRLRLLIENKEKMISQLKNNIADKNLKFDQIVEDYNGLKEQLNSQIDELKDVINYEKKKYESLKEQYDNEIAEYISKVKVREEKILELSSENSSLKEKNEQILKENKFLMRTINDFTTRMSASFPHLSHDEKNETE